VRRECRRFIDLVERKRLRRSQALLISRLVFERCRCWCRKPENKVYFRHKWRPTI